MNAITLLQTLILVEPATTKLEAAQNVLNELNRMKQLKGMPYLTIRRAIKIQNKIIKKIQ